MTPFQNNFDSIIAQVQSQTPDSATPPLPPPGEPKRRPHFGKPKEKQQKSAATEAFPTSTEPTTSSPSKGPVQFENDGVSGDDFDGSLDKEHPITTISERTEPVEASSRQQEPAKKEKKSWFGSKKRTAVTIK